MCFHTAKLKAVKRRHKGHEGEEYLVGLGGNRGGGDTMAGDASEGLPESAAIDGYEARKWEDLYVDSKGNGNGSENCGRWVKKA